MHTLLTSQHFLNLPDICACLQVLYLQVLVALGPDVVNFYRSYMVCCVQLLMNDFLHASYICNHKKLLLGHTKLLATFWSKETSKHRYGTSCQFYNP